MPLTSSTLAGTAFATPTTAVPVQHFPSGDVVDMAADAVRSLIGYTDPEAFVDRAVARYSVGYVSVRTRYTFDLAAGVVALKVHGPRTWDVDAVDYSSEVERTLFAYEGDGSLELHVPGETAEGAEIREWSRASRARFHRRMGELDFSVFEGQRLAMLTLTLPNHWQRIAPDGRTFKRLLRTFRKSWERVTGSTMRCVWKLEFQGRGAPHVHMLVAVPDSMGGTTPAAWIGAEWVRICNPQGEDRARMLAAHLPSRNRPAGVLDFSRNLTDPKRLAVYFGKHASKSRDSKEYQHQVPMEWWEPGKGPGRFWGYWGLKRAVASVEVTREDFYALRRILRHVDRARAFEHAMKVRAKANLNGEALRRATLEGLRTPKHRRLTGQGGGWVLSNDALMTAWDMARAISHRSSPPPLG